MRFLLLLLPSFFFSNLSALNIHLCQQKLLQPLPSWALEQIEEDLLGPFADNGITQKAIEATLKKSVQDMIEGQICPHAFARIRIIDNKIYLHKDSRDCYLTATLKKLRTCTVLPNVDFIVNLSDGTPESYNRQDYWVTENPLNQAPLFGRSKKTWAKYVVIIPDYTAFDLDDLTKHILAANESHSWSNKIRKVFWRGSRSDAWKNSLEAFSFEETREFYSTRPRFILSKYSVLYPDLIDAGILSNTVTHASNFNDFLEQEHVFKLMATIPDHIRFAYLPCLDGWSCTYPGYYWRLLSNSLVFKNESDQQLWFYKALKPYVHYIPLKYDLSDIFEKLEWAKQNDATCQQIAKKSTQLVLDQLSEEDNYAYLFKTLKFYENIQRFDGRDFLFETEYSEDWTKLN